MKVTAERIDNHKVVLTVVVEKEKVSKYEENAYARIANSVKIPGFRKGKVPKNIIDQRIGKEAVQEETKEFIVNGTLVKAMLEQNVENITRPEIEWVEGAEECTYKATFTAKPEVKLGEYKGLKVEKQAAEVTDAQINEQIDKMRESNAKMVVAEGAEIQNGDFAVIDFKGFVDDVAFPGGEGKGYPLQIGSGSFIPGFEEQLIGAKAGDERDVNVTFPEEYHAPDLAGKAAVFKVQVNDVKRKEMPQLNDEFVKSITSFNTVDELRADVKAKLEETAAKKAENDMRSAAVKLAADNAEVEIPAVMIENRVDNMLEELNISLQQQGLNLEQYMKYAKTDIEKLRSEYHDTAATNVRTDLVLEAIAKVEKIEVRPEDIKAEIEMMARAYGAKVKEVEKIIKEQRRIGVLVDNIARKKAAKLVIDSIAAE